MAEDLKKMYRKVMEDHFPDTLRMSFGEQDLVYRKRSWKFPDEKSAELIEKGLRYGENPGQEAALYELVGGNLILGACRFIEPGNGLVSSISEQDMLQEGKHPGKINLTDLDNGLNILKYLMEKPTAAILKHNNPCGAAHWPDLADAYHSRKPRRPHCRFRRVPGCQPRRSTRPRPNSFRKTTSKWSPLPDYEEGSLAILKKRPGLRIIQVSRIDRLPGLYRYAVRRFQVSYRWRPYRSAIACQ